MSNPSSSKAEEGGSPIETPPSPELKQSVPHAAERSGTDVEPQKLERMMQAVLTGVSVAYQRQGPLPHPQELAEYDKALPGSAERILAASERQSAHRIRLEEQTVTAQNRQSARGQIYGLVIALVCLVLSFIAVLTGHDVAGTILGTVDLVSLVAIFVYGKNAQRIELATKKSTTPGASRRAEKKT